MAAKTHYETLGVSRGASADEIKRAYRSLAREHHPDRNAGDESAEEKFKEVGTAFNVLSDPNKRELYDEMGDDAERIGWDRKNARRGRGGKGGMGPDLEDLFGGGGGRRAGPRAGQDVSTRIQVGFEEAVRGGVRQVRIEKPVRCDPCQGAGTRPAKGNEPCSDCGGAGQVQVEQAGLQFAIACPTCGGSGKPKGPTCGTCAGHGQVKSAVKLDVRLPAGVRSGQKIRLGGQGGAGQRGGPAGDLFIEVSVAEHPWFTRDGRNLYIEVPITLPEALLGGEVDIPTLDGIVKLKVPAGAQSDSKMRLRGKGVPAHGKHSVGDLYAILKVRLPKLGEDESVVREAAEQLAGLYDGPVRKWSPS